MVLCRLIGILYFVFIPVFAFSQSENSASNPRILQQQNNKSIKNVHPDPDGKYYLVEQGDNEKEFLLYDQLSKIMVGKLNLHTTSNPGAGKLKLIKGGRFLISLDQEILLCDPVEGDTFAVFRSLEFPEFILNFSVVDDDKLLIATKIYEEDSEGFINFTDISNKGRLLIYDLNKKEILNETLISYEPTTLFFQKASIYIGNNLGEIVQFDADLNEVQKIKLFKNPVFYLNLLDDKIIAVPHLGEDITFFRGKGEVYTYNLNTSKKQRFKLPEDKPEVKGDRLFKPVSENLVDNILVKNGHELIISFGHAQLGIFNVKDLALTKLKIEGFESISSIGFNRDSTQLFFAHGNWSPMGNSHAISFYDLNREIVLPSFRKNLTPLSNREFYYKKDSEGNIYLFSKGDVGYSDTLNIYPSNRFDATQLICTNCNFKVNERDNLLTIKYYQNVIVGKLFLENISKSQYTLEVQWDGTITGDNEQMIFEPLKSIQLKDIIEGSISNVQFNEKGEYWVTTYEQSGKSNIYFFDEKDELKKQIKDVQYILGAEEVQFSSDWRYAAYFKRIGKSKIQLVLEDMESDQKLFQQKYEAEVQAFKFSELDNLYINLFNNDEEWQFVKLNINEGEEVYEQFLNLDLFFLDFSINETGGILAYDTYEQVGLYDLNKKRNIIKKKISGGLDFVDYVSDWNGFFFSAGNEALLLKDSVSIQMIEYPKLKQAIIVNDLYYMMPPALLGSFGFEYERNGFRVSDFDLYFNRPDYVLNYIGSKNAEYNRAVASSFEKRMNYYGLEDQNIVHTDYFKKYPIVDIVNEKEIKEVSHENNLNLIVHATDDHNNVKAIHIFVNGVPLYGQSGHPYKEKNKEVTFSVELSNGNNLIQVASENELGILSPSKTINVLSTRNVKPDLHLIAVSVSDYQDDNYDLNYARKDGEDLLKFLGNKTEKFNDIYTYSLYDSMATLENFRSLKYELEKTNVNDQVILFLSGHGLLDSSYNFYFASYNCNFKNPERHGISYTEIHSLLDSIPAREKILLMDACHSGELDEQGLLAESNEINIANHANPDLKKYETKGTKVTSTKKNLGLSNSFQLMKSLFANLTIGSGTIVISAASGDSYALESSIWNNGVFTYSILDGLYNKTADLNGDGEIKVSELKEFVYKKVVKETNGRQQPTTREENIENDFIIWK